jgi:hypothetical protein
MVSYGHGDSFQNTEDPARCSRAGLFHGRMMFTLEANLDQFERGLTDFERRQVPFAIATAINWTLDDVKVTEERRLLTVLDRPTRFTQRGLIIRRASKRRLEGEVRFKDIQRSYLLLQERGGQRLPRKTAIPVPVRQRVNQYGNMPRGVIRRLLARPDTFSGEVNGVAGIWQRPRKRGGPLKLLVAYEPKARYEPRLRFEASALAVAQRRLPFNMSHALANAIRTAR